MHFPESIEPLRGAALKRANEIYAALHFVQSDERTARTFGLSEAGAPERLIALGRLHRHDDNALEAGGFWVHELHRGKGLARRLVTHVLAARPPSEPVWCIPFTHLVDFYTSFGFQRVDLGTVPEPPPSIRGKVDLCRAEHGRGHYSETVLLRLDP